MGSPVGSALPAASSSAEEKELFSADSWLLAAVSACSNASSSSDTGFGGGVRFLLDTNGIFFSEEIGLEGASATFSSSAASFKRCASSAWEMATFRSLAAVRVTSGQKSESERHEPLSCDWTFHRKFLFLNLCMCLPLPTTCLFITDRPMTIYRIDGWARWQRVNSTLTWMSVFQIYSNPSFGAAFGALDIWFSEARQIAPFLWVGNFDYQRGIFNAGKRNDPSGDFFPSTNPSLYRISDVVAIVICFITGRVSSSVAQVSSPRAITSCSLMAKISCNGEGVRRMNSPSNGS